MSAVQQEQIYAKIGEVLDPELDQPLLDLGFIERVDVEGAAVTVSFRLPTYWCAPNFAFLIAADLQQKVGEVDGVETVRVFLADHFADGEINEGINSGKSFSETFPGDAAEELDDLRRTFAIKAFLVRQEQLMRRLLKAGCSPKELCALRIGGMTIDGDDVMFRGAELPPAAWRVEKGAEAAAAYLRKRAALHLATAPDAVLFTDAGGAPIKPDGFQEYLRHSRATRLNMAFNTTLCSGLLRARFRGSDGVRGPAEDGAARGGNDRAGWCEG